MPIRKVCEDSGAILFIPTASEQRVKHNQEKVEELARQLEQELALVRQYRESLGLEAPSTDEGKDE